MKTRYLLLLCTLAPTTASQSQPRSTAKARYNAVNRALTSAKVTRLELEGYSTEGSELIAYTRNGQPQKLVARYFGETGRASEEYYFWKGQLFFVLRNDVSYQFPLGHKGAPGKETQLQQRFYFQNGRLTRWINENGKANDLKTTAALRSEQEFVKEARTFLAKIRGSKR